MPVPKIGVWQRAVMGFAFVMLAAPNARNAVPLSARKLSIEFIYSPPDTLETASGGVIHSPQGTVLTEVKNVRDKANSEA